MSLRNPLQKMSKSDNQDLTRINLDDPPDTIRIKLRKAVTDCTSEITYDPINRPGVSNLVSIYSSITGTSPDQVVEEFVGKETVLLKDSLADIIIEHLKPLQEKMIALEQDGSYVTDVLKVGAEKAQVYAQDTLCEMKQILGID